MLRIPIPPDAEIIETLQQELADRRITDGAIVALIGMVVGCKVSTMRASDSARDVIVEYTAPLELSGNGDLQRGKVHLHVVLGAEGNVSIAGHLQEAIAGRCATTAYVVPLDT